MDEEARFGVDPEDGAPRRGRALGLALVASLVVHGFALLLGPVGDAPAPGPLTLSVELVRLPPPEASTERDEPEPPPSLPPARERVVSERLASERLASERLVSERLVSERLAPVDPGDSALVGRERGESDADASADRDLDLTVPDRFLVAPSRERALFDGRLAERLREARAARRDGADSATGGPITWAGAGAGRTRIETARGCFERVTDPFDVQAGDQWWFVDCGDREAAIDWGARFRARP